MTQSTDVTLSNQSGNSYRTEHNSINQAFMSNHKGGSEPSYIITGGHWIDDSATPWVFKIYDGADSFGFLEINPSTNNFGLINIKNGDARTEGANIGQIQDSAFIWLGTSSGTNTITASTTPAITAYAAGQHFIFLAGGSNTGATTININSLGAKAIEKLQSPLTSGDITSGDVCVIVYDGTQFQLVSRGGGANQASQAAIEAETNEDTYVPPDLVRHNPGVAKAWADVDLTGTASLDANYNVSAFSDDGTGLFTLTWGDDFSNTNYVCAGMTSAVSAGNDEGLVTLVPGSRAVGSAQFQCVDVNNTADNFDFDPVMVVVFGDQ